MPLQLCKLGQAYQIHYEQVPKTVKAQQRSSP